MGIEFKNKIAGSPGFTLIEIIIYTAVSGIILISFVNFIFSITEIRNKNYVVQEVQANGRVALNLITQKIRSADNVIGPAEGSSGNSLTLDMPGTAVNTVFSLQNGILKINEGSGEVSLTGQRTDITSLTFTNLASSGEKDNIKISLTIEYKNNSGDKYFSYTENLETAVGLRK